MLFSELLVEYLEYLEAVGRSQRTLASYDQRLVSFVALHGSQAVEAITPRDVDQWLLGLRRQTTVWAGHPYHPAQSRPLSPVTIHTRARSLIMCFEYAQRRGHISHSPAAHLRLSKPRTKRLRAVAPPDMVELIRAAKMRAGDGQCRDLAILGFMLDTGARAGEVVSVLRDEVVLGDCSAVVDGKTGRRRVYFTQPTADLIGRWLVDHPGGAWLFCGLHRRLGQQMTVDSLYQMFRRRGADRGVTGIHNPHGVRHLVGQAAAQNLGVRDAQLLLGHLDISSTMVYASPDESRLREVVGMVKPLG